MPRLHLFFPENDLALARNLEHYTPPPAAARLRRSGAMLALWYGTAGDRVADEGVDAGWYNKVRDRFGLLPEIFTGDTTGLVPAPWGWSKASRHWFRKLGFSPEILPDDARLDAIRALSHRRTAIAIAEQLGKVADQPTAPPAREIFSVAEARIFVHETGSTLFKLPWSSSGRGLIEVPAKDFECHADALGAVIARQGSVMAERKYNKIIDFAMLFTMADGICHYDGLSLFHTERLGNYIGNELAPQDELRRRIEATTGPIESIVSALPPILENIIGRTYNGPLGIDMMGVNEPDFALAPTVELNLRMTMGHVCRRFYAMHVTAGAQGLFKVCTTGAGSDTAVTEDMRIIKGNISMSPPGADFSFEAHIF